MYFLAGSGELMNFVVQDIFSDHTQICRSWTGSHGLATRPDVPSLKRPGRANVLKSA